MRLGVRKLLFVSVMIFAAFTLTAKDVFSADYIPAPVLVETSPKTITVTVNLTASPTEGLAPLNVTFTCTASAEVYYIETWAQPPQGSVDKEKEITETHPAKITKMPVLEEPISEPGIHPFTATAEYEGVTGEGFTTVVVKKPNCADLLARKAALEKELADLEKKVSDLLRKEAILAHKISEYQKSSESLNQKGRDLMDALKEIGYESRALMQELELLAEKQQYNDEDILRISQLKTEAEEIIKRSRETRNQMIRVFNQASKYENLCNRLEEKLKEVRRSLDQCNENYLSIQYELVYIEKMLYERGCL